MSLKVLLIILFTLVIPILVMIYVIWWYYRNRQQVESRTYGIVSDRDILLLISSQPDGMLTVKQLAERTGMTKNEARTRLTQLYYFGTLTMQYSDGLRYYYSLAGELDKRPPPKLSEQPFLTVDDILTIFKHHDYRVTPLDLVVATGLPLSIIRKEIKYFTKEKIIQRLMRTSTDGTYTKYTYALQEPYRSHPEQFLDRQLDLNRKVKQLLRREDLV